MKCKLCPKPIPPESANEFYCSHKCWNKHQTIMANLRPIETRYCDCGKETTKTDCNGKPLIKKHLTTVKTCGDRKCVQALIEKNRGKPKPVKVVKVKPVKKFQPPMLSGPADHFLYARKPTETAA